MNVEDRAQSDEGRPEWLDWDRALRVVDDDLDLLRHLLGVFLRQFSDTVQALSEAAAAGDWQTVSRTAHKLAGAAGAIGIDVLDRLARAVDRPSRALLEDGSGGRQEVDAALNALLPLLERIQREAPHWIEAGEKRA